jgi:hypothetical protein
MPNFIKNRSGKSLGTTLAPRSHRSSSGQVNTLWFGVGELLVEYLVIAGGGGGGAGYNSNGGGGAGGYRNSVAGELSGGGAVAETPFVAAGTTYTITVGNGGGAGLVGGNSSIVGGSTSIISLGGGAGGHTSYGNANGAGGSGGGNSVSAAWTAPRTQPGGTTTTAIAGTPGQGFAGGTWYGQIYNGVTDEVAGGGGGAGSAGGAASLGRGAKSAITGTLIGRAGGGASLWHSRTSGLENQTNTNVNDETGTSVNARTVYGSGNASGAAVANTGGGGRHSQSGASGVVILRYPDSFDAAVTTGSPIITAAGGFRIYQFNGSGSIIL